MAERKLLRMLREREVCVAMGWSRSMLWKQIKAGRFKKPIKVAPHMNAWTDDDVAEEQERLIAERNA